ncbi:uncharacterized protein B0H18DRAFT_984737, partial [Fomitopsis serialis]|uniref:uncharacterized protein n=1 Tax=Fomitopsis serialis TaxID=139415 RepID=UPI0020089B16
MGPTPGPVSNQGTETHSQPPGTPSNAPRQASSTGRHTIKSYPSLCNVYHQSSTY